MYSFMHVVEAKDGRKRLLDGYANLGFFFSAGSRVVEPMWERFFEILQEMDQTARSEGAVFVLVIFPQRFQVQPRDWQVMCDHAGLVSRDFDLELPERRILDYCRQHGILCLDLLEPMRQAAATQDLYLPAGDMHFNQVGTRIAATRVSDFIRKNLSVVRPPLTSSP
jgi:hypothetical protein